MANNDPSQPRRSPTIASGRLGRIIIAYVVVCLIVAIVLPLCLILRDVAVGQPLAEASLGMIVLVVAGTFLVALVAAAPFATAFIIVSETYRIRALWAHAAFGAATGLIIQAVAGVIAIGKANASVASWPMFLLFALVGALGGAIYWLLAVRGRRQAVQ